MTVSSSEGPRQIAAQRSALSADVSLVGSALRQALNDLYLGWLTELLADPGEGVALVAVGGAGRAELALGSDLDLVLVHAAGRDVTAIADRVWYPVWDAGIGLDHSVRTVEQALDVAQADLKAALGLLDVRHVAGDVALSTALLGKARAQWRRAASRRLPELRAAVTERAETVGEVAFLLEPDLKEARGGLRDVHALQALAVAQVVDAPATEVRAAHQVLLDARGELHRRTAGAGRRVEDRLLMQEQDTVAAALSYADADALMRAVSDAARTIAYASDTTWRRALPKPAPRSLFGRRKQTGPERIPLADDVVSQEGEVVLARDAEPAKDPVLVLRAAQAAARAGLPIAPGTLEVLARKCPPLPEPWPRPALEAFVNVLAAGSPAVRVVESLDHAGLLVRLLPEWEHTRSRPQRNSYHRFTVDRHLLEAAAGAAKLTRRVSRPDLLLLGALFHDIGKGLPGDHSVVGMQMMATLGPRLGLPPADVAVLTAMIEHHLLLPVTATRRDLADPATAAGVAEAVRSPAVLELLHALTEADSLATGPAAWSAWKARLVAELVARTAALLAGAPPPPPAPLADWQEELVAGGEYALAARDDEVTVVASDRPGLLSLAAGVLALHRLDVRSASVFDRGSTSVTVLRVAPRFGSLPDWTVVREELRLALQGQLPLRQALAERESAYARASPVPSAPPTVKFIDEASERATVIEVRAPDGLGVLHRITTALLGCGLDIRTAHLSSVGADVIDSFYVVGADGEPVREEHTRVSVVEKVLAALT